jgi:translocation protein SEC63
MLDYDNNAFYYFSITLLVLYLIPAIYYVLSEIVHAFVVPLFSSNKPRTEEEKRKFQKLAKETTGIARLKKTAFLVNLSLLCLAIPLFFYLIALVKKDGEVNSFDPFQILGIEQDASESEIKKVYRRLSLKYHPDKNPGNKAAEEMFVKITKAHAALTDETSKENYRRYGNPDGKQSLEVSIGLPRWVLDNPKIVLILYLVGMVVVIPVAVGWWYSNSKQFGEKNILYATYQAFYQNLEQTTRFVHLPELLASSAEFRALNAPKPNEADVLGRLYNQLKDDKLFNSNKDQQLRYPDHPAILRGNLLLFAHGLRRTDNLPQVWNTVVLFAA